MQRTANNAGGFSIAHDPAWQVRSEGASTVVMPSADPATLEYYGVSAAPWTSSKPLSVAAHADEAARLLLADAPLLKRDGAIERVRLPLVAARPSDAARGESAQTQAETTTQTGTQTGTETTTETDTEKAEENAQEKARDTASRPREPAATRQALNGDGPRANDAAPATGTPAKPAPREVDAILIRASAQTEGGSVRVVVLARNLGESLVGLVAFGDDRTIAAREDRARVLFASIEPLAPARRAAGGAGVATAADLVFSGRWKTEEVLASGGGFDVGGQASMVTERILELGRDGRFALGARSAGGGSGVAFEGGFRVDARGSWRVERAGELAYLVLSAEGAAPERVRCAMHEGKLVLGEPGARTFFDRAE